MNVDHVLVAVKGIFGTVCAYGCSRDRALRAHIRV